MASRGETTITAVNGKMAVLRAGHKASLHVLQGAAVAFVGWGPGSEDLVLVADNARADLPHVNKEWRLRVVDVAPDRPRVIVGVPQDAHLLGRVVKLVRVSPSGRTVAVFSLDSGDTGQARVLILQLDIGAGTLDVLHDLRMSRPCFMGSDLITLNPLTGTMTCIGSERAWGFVLDERAFQGNVMHDLQDQTRAVFGADPAGSRLKFRVTCTASLPGDNGLLVAMEVQWRVTRGKTYPNPQVRDNWVVARVQRGPPEDPWRFATTMILNSVALPGLPVPLDVFYDGCVVLGLGNRTDALSMSEGQVAWIAACLRAARLAHGPPDTFKRSRRPRSP
jgi:hypothetical protein